MQTVIIDPEFAGLIPPLQDDEYEQLKAAILADGCRDALVVWKGHNILVDGHNRYRICSDNAIEFRVMEREFVDRRDVRIWMRGNQIARRNIPDFLRVEFAWDNAQEIEEAANERMKAGKPIDPETNSSQGRTAEKVADNASVGTSFAKQVKKVKEVAPAKIKEKARKGQISTNKAYDLTRELEKLPLADRDIAADLCEDNLEKANILNRLYKSAGSVESNGTYFEIISAGGFHFGKDMKLHCDFKAASIQEIQRALDDIAKQHAVIEMERRKAEQEAQRAQTAIQILEKVEVTDYVQGDCLTLLPSLPDNSIRLLLTDPPYGVDFQSNRRTATAKADKIDGDESPQDAALLLRDMLRIVTTKMAQDSRILVFTSQAYYSLFRAIITESGFTCGRTLTWVKENHTSGNLDDFAPQTEWVINAWRGKPSINHRISEVLSFRRESNTSHPTEKPMQMLMELIKQLTLPDELVVDPFAGTGATVEAARRLGRRVYGIEKQQTWYDEGVIRLQGVQPKAA